MKNSKKSWRRRAEIHLETALYAYPALYCRSKSLRPNMPIAIILDAFREHRRTELSRMPFWLRTLVVYSWPPGAVLVALYQTVRNGRFAARKHRRGVVRQFTDQIRLAFADGVPPIFYYLYELHDPEKARRAFAYIHRGHTKNNGLYKFLYRKRPERNARAKLLNNKLEFYRFCQDRALPTAEIFGVAENGRISWFDESRDRLPDESLFVKLRNGKGGRGAERWTYENGVYSEIDGRRLDSDQMTTHLIEASLSSPRLIQKNLVNHPALGALTAGALSTLRMYTVLDEEGRPELIHTKLRMSRDPQSAVDNIHRGGLGARVDGATGRLECATNNERMARLGWLEHHPVSGARILGHQVPFWRESVDLALAAHSALNEAFVVGWDIGVTGDGPRLIEGNKSPDFEIDQRLTFPWGNERFGELLAFHIRAVVQDQFGPDRTTPGRA
jgi:hypothetical protein